MLKKYNTEYLILRSKLIVAAGMVLRSYATEDGKFDKEAAKEAFQYLHEIADSIQPLAVQVIEE